MAGEDSKGRFAEARSREEYFHEQQDRSSTKKALKVLESDQALGAGVLDGYRSLVPELMDDLVTDAVVKVLSDYFAEISSQSIISIAGPQHAILHMACRGPSQ